MIIFSFSPSFHTTFQINVFFEEKIFLLLERKKEPSSASNIFYGKNCEFEQYFLVLFSLYWPIFVIILKYCHCLVPPASFHICSGIIHKFTCLSGSLVLYFLYTLMEQRFLLVIVTSWSSGSSTRYFFLLTFYFLFVACYV